MTNDQMTHHRRWFSCHSSFVLVSSFDIRASTVGHESVWTIRFWTLARMQAPAHKTIVSPRAGPTLTIDNFAPVNSEMYLRYFLAAGGSCENFRAT